MVEYRKVERCSRSLSVAVGEKLVIRVWRWDLERLVKDATDDYEIETALRGAPPPYFSISVFALARRADESIDDLVDRLTWHAAEHRRFQWYCLVTESELSIGNHQLILHEPPKDHYDILLGEAQLDIGKVAKLSELFGIEKIRMRT